MHAPFAFFQNTRELLNITARSSCGFRSWKKHSWDQTMPMGFFNFFFFLGVFPLPMLVVEKQFKGF